MNILVALTQGLPVGTNLALLHFLWMLVSGALLPQRGALFPALQSTGLSEQATRRAWAAFRRGAWQTVVILRLWQEQIRLQPLPYGGKGRRPVYGEKIRPLERSYKGKTIAASSPDRVETWTEDGVERRAEIWEDLILPGVIPDPGAKTFRVYAIYDPAYTTPWLLATPLDLKAATVKAMYQDRWPVEQIPLSAKQMVGAHRQFVHADESIQRLPQLALLAGSILSYLAATAPLAPTGFWDRQPKRTPGRFRRMLRGMPFPQSYPLPSQLRKKMSVTRHLPKGILAHRRKSTASAPVSVS